MPRVSPASKFTCYRRLTGGRVIKIRRVQLTKSPYSRSVKKGKFYQKPVRHHNEQLVEGRWVQADYLFGRIAIDTSATA